MHHWPAAVFASLALAVAAPAHAETTPAECETLVALVRDFTGYAAKAPPAGAVGGWCVLDAARLVSDRADQPDLRADVLRLRGEAEAGAVIAVELQATGLRLVQGLGAKQLDERLQAMLRLQSGDLRLRVAANADSGRVEIRGFSLVLSGGTDLQLEADLAGAGLSPLGLAVGRLTALDLRWTADGRLMRHVLEAAGAGGDPDPAATEAIPRAREALQAVIAALPGTLVADADRRALAGLAASLPQARGVLVLSFSSDDGIGAADLLVAGLTEAPLGAASLAGLFAGSRLQADWSPGMAP